MLDKNILATTEREYNKHPITKKYFEYMNEDELEKSYAEFICNYAVVLAKRYNIDISNVVEHVDKIEPIKLLLWHDMNIKYINELSKAIKHIRLIDKTDTSLKDKIINLTNVIDNILRDKNIDDAYDFEISDEDFNNPNSKSSLSLFN